MLQADIIEGGNGLTVLGGRHIARFGLRASSQRLNAAAVIPENGTIKDGSVLVQNMVAHVMNPVDHIVIIATVADSSHADMLALDTINQVSSTGRIANRYLLGIINSRLMSWYMYRFVYGRAIRTMHFDASSTDRMPIPPIDFNLPEDKRRHDHLVTQVKQMLEAKRQEAVATGQAKEIAVRKCAALDRRIDALVYELYGLTDEEIALVEQSSP